MTTIAANRYMEIAGRFCEDSIVRGSATPCVSPTHVYATDGRALLMVPHHGACQPGGSDLFPRERVGTLRKVVEAAPAATLSLCVHDLLLELDRLAPKALRCADCGAPVERDAAVTHTDAECSGELKTCRSFVSGVSLFAEAPHLWPAESNDDDHPAGGLACGLAWLTPYWLGLALEGLRDLGASSVEVRLARRWREPHPTDEGVSFAVAFVATLPAEASGTVVVVMPRARP